MISSAHGHIRTSVTTRISRHDRGASFRGRFSSCCRQKGPCRIGTVLRPRRSSRKICLGTITAVGKMGYEVVEFYCPVPELDARDRERRPQASRRRRPEVPLDAQRRPVVHRRWSEEGDRAESDHRQQEPDHGERAARHRHRCLEDARRSADVDLGASSSRSAWRPDITTTRSNGVRIDGQRPMDVIAAGTPKDVVLQFDVGTCVEVGADPIAWIKAQPGTHQEHALQGLGGRDAATTSRSAKATRRGSRSSRPSRDTGGVEILPH